MGRGWWEGREAEGSRGKALGTGEGRGMDRKKREKGEVKGGGFSQINLGGCGVGVVWVWRGCGEGTSLHRRS